MWRGGVDFGGSRTVRKSSARLRFLVAPAVRVLARGHFALALMAIPAGAVAAPESGTVLAVVQSANVDGATGRQVLQPEAPVYSGDKIITGQAGSAQIQFRDNTKLAVGPNSSISIDAFVFSNTVTARQISISVAKGALRFFTGTSPKDAYAINTPTSTIGVRGTQFDVDVEQGGTTRVANFEGMTHICQRQANGSISTTTNACVDVSEPCSLSVIRPTKSGVVKYSNNDIDFRNRQLKYYFPYVRDQSPLLPDFRVDLAQCNFAEVITPPGGQAPAPGVAPTPPGVTPPPTPKTISLPSPTTPSLPSLQTPDHDRPVYDHGPVFR